MQWGVKLARDIRVILKDVYKRQNKSKTLEF